MQIVNELKMVVKSKKEVSAERHLGYLCYVERMPLCVCGTLTMVEGWFQALRDEANADASAFIEGALMHADADALESGQRVPLVRLTDEQVREMEDERIGEFETFSPWR